MKRMMNRKLSMAFEKWQAEAAQMKHEQAMLKKAVMRMVQRQMAMAWSKWREAASEAKAMIERLRRGLAFWMEGELGRACAPCCVCWVGVCARVHVVSLTPLRCVRVACLLFPWPVGGPPLPRGDLCMGAVSVCGPSCVLRVRACVCDTRGESV